MCDNGDKIVDPKSTGKNRLHYTCACGNVKELIFKVLNFQEYSFCPTCRRNTLWTKIPNGNPINKGVSGHPGPSPDKIKEIWPDHCVKGDTLVVTEHGPVPIKQLVEKPGDRVINVSEELFRINKIVERALGLSATLPPPQPKSLRYNLLTGDADKEFTTKCKELSKKGC